MATDALARHQEERRDLWRPRRLKQFEVTGESECRDDVDGHTCTISNKISG